MPEGDEPHIPGVKDELLDDGRLTAMNHRGDEWNVRCPFCAGIPSVQANCPECAGRGHVDHVPYPERPWDQVAQSLYVGGHQCHPKNGVPGTVGEVWVRDEFTLVVSLHTVSGEEGKRFGPTKAVHLKMSLRDAHEDFSQHHADLDYLVNEIVKEIEDGGRVLVRCMAGINRSAMVAAMVMVRQGWLPEAAIRRIREVRSPYCLFNPNFVEHIRAQQPMTGLPGPLIP